MARVIRVSATQVLAETLVADSDYLLAVSVGRFLPDQPYAFSLYGGYVVELLAGDTVIARDADGALPPVGSFRDAVAFVGADAIDPGSVGLPLAVRLSISADTGPHSTHFDNARVWRRTLRLASPTPRSPMPPGYRSPPHPVRGLGDVHFVLTESGRVSLELYDARGRRHHVLVGNARLAKWHPPGPLDDDTAGRLATAPAGQSSEAPENRRPLSHPPCVRSIGPSRFVITNSHSFPPVRDSEHRDQMGGVRRLFKDRVGLWREGFTLPHRNVHARNEAGAERGGVR